MGAGIKSGFLVTTDTTRSQLAAYLDSQGTGANTRLLGKTDPKTGGTILYTSQTRASLFDRLTGTAGHRRADARAAIDGVMTRYEGKAAARGLGSAGREVLFGNIRAQVNVSQTSAVRAGAAASALREAKLVTGLLPKPVGSALAPASAKPPGLQLDDARLRMGDIADAATAFAGLDFDGISYVNAKSFTPELTRALEGFGASIASGLGRGCNEAAKDTLAVTDGETLRRELAEVFQEALPEGCANARHADEFVRLAVSVAQSALGANKAGPATVACTWTTASGGSKTVDVPEITIKTGTTTKTYVPERHLGSGGYADAFLCRAADGSTMVLKLPPMEESITEIDDGSRDMAAEVSAHKQATANHHGNIIDMVGAVRLPDGRIAVALETAPNGDLEGMSRTIRDAVGTGPGKISADAADVLRFALLVDLAKGLKEMRDQNLIHLDFKAPNCLIGADGAAKIADFGLTRTGPSTGAAEIMEKNQTPGFMSPEMANFDTARKLVEARATAAENADATRVDTTLGNLLSGLSGENRAILAGDIKTANKALIEAKRDRDTAAIGLTAASDAFGLGLAAYRMFTGREMDLGQGRDWQKQDRLGEYLDKPGAVALKLAPGTTQKDPDSLGTPTHDEEADALINALMDPSPANRPSMDTLLSTSVLRHYSDDIVAKAHGLVGALASGDPQRIDAAKAVLATVM